MTVTSWKPPLSISVTRKYDKNNNTCLGIKHARISVFSTSSTLEEGINLTSHCSKSLWKLPSETEFPKWWQIFSFGRILLLQKRLPEVWVQSWRWDWVPLLVWTGVAHTWSQGDTKMATQAVGQGSRLNGQDLRHLGYKIIWPHPANLTLSFRFPISKASPRLCHSY